jgi:hypothetical protein
MKNPAILVSLNGWADTLFESPYLYIAIGGIIIVISICILWCWLRKPKALTLSARASHKNKPNETPASFSENLPTEACIENYARRVAEKVLSLDGKTKSVLLAGAGLESLPITISVKAAIQLVQTGKKCILIDLDTRRNAAAKVFDIHSDDVKYPRPKPIPTIIDNLSLWPAEFFVRFARMNLQHVVQSSSRDYEIVLVNAPYLDGHPDRKLIVSCVEYSLIFCRKPQQLERLTQLLNDGNCKLLSPLPANQ